VQGIQEKERRFTLNY